MSVNIDWNDLQPDCGLLSLTISFIHCIVGWMSRLGWSRQPSESWDAGDLVCRKTQAPSSIWDLELMSDYIIEGYLVSYLHSTDRPTFADNPVMWEFSHAFHHTIHLDRLLFQPLDLPSSNILTGAHFLSYMNIINYTIIPKSERKTS